MEIKKILFYKKILSHTLKSWGMLLILYFVSMFSHLLPSYAVIIACIILAFPNIQSLIYLNVIRKTVRQRHYVEGCFLSRRNNRKTFSIIISYFFSLASAFLVFLEIPTWNSYIWFVVAFILIPVFYMFFLVIGDFLSTQFKGLYLDFYKISWCLVITPVFITIIYFACEYALIPFPEYNNIEEALLYHQYSNVLNKSSSSLIKEVVRLTSMYDALNDYIFSVASKRLFSMFYSMGNILINAGIFFYITNILVFFTIPKEQLKRNFRPLSPNEQLDSGAPLQKKYIILLAVLMAITITVFIELDTKFKETGHFMLIEHLMEDTIKSFRAL